MTQPHPIAPRQGAESRVAELHRLCDEDYAKGQSQRAAASAATRGPVTEPTDLAVAIRVAQQLLDSEHALSLRESLRLLLRALGAEPVRPPLQVERRCPAAHPEDLTPCSGPVSVTILDGTNQGAEGCEHHGARLLASLKGGRVYALPDAPAGVAIRVFKTASATRPFPWVDGPRTRPSQLSADENRRRGEGQ